jgi:energy-coupling factor transporter ATP-binding protein EcfA2
MPKQLTVDEFLKILKKRGFTIKSRIELDNILGYKGTRQIQQDNSLISVKQINQILKALYQHPLTSDEKAENKQKRKDMERGGLLSLDTSNEALKDVNQWWKDYFQEKFKEINSLGVVCVGGFLRGENGQDKEPAVAYCSHGLDIFIGDRGSGKSTFLKMFALLSNCLREDTKFTDSLEWLEEESENKEVQWERQIGNFLSEHDIEKYACYFYHNQHLWVFYAQITNQTRNTGIYTLFRHDDQTKQWISIQDIESDETDEIECSQFFPNMKVFNQGEIISIANKEGNKALNKILVQDSLYLELKKQQAQLLRVGTKFSTYLENEENNQDSLQEKMIVLNWELFQKFIDKYHEQLEFLKQYVEKKEFDEVIEEINRMIYGRYKRADQFLAQNNYERSIFKLLQLSNLSVTEYRYLSIDESSRTLELEDPLLEEYLKETIEQILIYLYLKPIRENLVFKIGLIQNLQKQKIKSDESLTIITKTINKILKILTKRLDYLNKLTITLGDLSTLSREYLGTLKDFLERHNQLICEQQKCCEDMTKTLSSYEPKIGFYTLEKNDENFNLNTIKHNEKLLNLIGKINDYQKFLTSQENFQHFTRVINNYQRTFEKLLDSISTVQNLDPEEYPYPPIYTEFGEDKVPKNFEKLSFGQKCGIILMIALKKTQSDIIILDQPEDNLDNEAVINIIAPMLSDLSKHNKLIILATHSANLVLNLAQSDPDPFLFVMENRLNFGRILRSGNLYSQEQPIMIDVIDVLEGGIEAVEDKFKTYSRLGEIFPELIMSDIIRRFNFDEFAKLRDFTFTIKNSTSDIITEMDFFKILRHEYVEKPNILDSNLEQFNKLRNQLETVNDAIARLNNLINDLETLHDKPDPKKVNLYEFFSSLIQSNNEWQSYAILDDKLKKISICVDPIHAKYAFINILKNSSQALLMKVEGSVTQMMQERLNQRLRGQTINPEFHHEIRISVTNESNSDSVKICIEDNGIGVEDDIKRKLYKEIILKEEDTKVRETQGHLIISNLLRLNKASIELDLERTIYDLKEGKTVQYVTIPIENSDQHGKIL